MARQCQSREVDIFENRYYNTNRIFLSLIGLWPYTSPRKRFIQVVIVNVTLLFLLITQVRTFLMIDNVKLLTEVLSNFFLYASAVFMYYNNLFNLSKINRLLEFIKRDWLEQKNPKRLEIMKGHAETGRTYVILLILASYGQICFTVCISSTPIIMDIILSSNSTRTRTLPYPVEGFFDLQNHFLLALLVESSSLCVLCIVGMSNHILFTILLHHICGMFCVVENMLDDAIDIEKERIRDHNSEARAYGKIVHSIKYHNRVLEFDCIFNATFEQGLSVACALCLSFIVVAFLRIMHSNVFDRNNVEETLLSLTTVSFNSSMLFAMCHMGQKVMEHSLSLFDKAFGIPWYELTRKSQTLIYCIMMRSSKPCYVMIGKFFILSIKFGASIIQTSLSYAMIIYSLQ